MRALGFAASIEILLAVGAVYGYHLHSHHAEGQAGIGKLTICSRVR